MDELIGINHLLDNTATINKSYEILAKSTGENFNIFSILRMESDENLTHSAFIAELLRKNGSHNYGNTFIKLFFECFEIEDFEFNFEKYDVITEYSIGTISNDYSNGGRIDILLRDNKENVIMIENKIYAGEQQKQLIRYKSKFPKGKLFFLTLYGDETSCAEARLIKDLYIPISYENDIINWMDMCRKEAIGTPMLREVISQYIYLLKNLTNQNANKEMNNEVIEKILSSNSSFKSYKSLLGVYNELIKTILKEDFLKVVEEVAVQNNMVFEIDDNFLSGNIYKGFWLKNEAFEKMNLCIRFSFESRDLKNALLGLAFLNPKIAKEFDYSKIVEKFDDIIGSEGMHSEGFARYFDFYKGEDWRNLNKLEDIRFGNFKADLIDKLQRLINIIK